MPTATIDSESGAIERAGPSVTTMVLRYDPAGGILLPLPNIHCISVSSRVGAEPWSARFRYVFDQLLDPTVYPSSFEQVFALSVPGTWGGSPFVVKHEDRVIVRAALPNGTWDVLFDGFARLPQVDYSDGGELVTFECIGTVERYWDRPIPGAALRDAPVRDALDELVFGEAVQTDLPTRFNPDGAPNATPEGADALVVGDLAEADTPIFVDPMYLDRFEGDSLLAVGRRWSLAMAARYLLVRGNVDQFWALNPNLDTLEIALSSVRPAEDYAYIDWRNPSSYVLSPIACPDLDVTGLSWPEALERLLAPYGFAIAFELETVFGGLPRWRLLVRRNDDNTFWKTLGLQARGATFDPSLNAIGAVQLQRDGLLANDVVLDASPARYEASFVLSPIGWAPDVADADKDLVGRWRRGTAEYDPVKYRVFGVDEAGEGHWDFAAGIEIEGVPQGDVSADPADFTAIFQPDDDPQAPRDWVRRPRPGSSKLLSRDADEKPRKMELWFAVLDEYAGPVPGVWESQEGLDWQQVTEGGWSLLPDRLGIAVTVEDARAWKVTVDGDKPIIPSGKLDLVQSMAAPSADAPTMPRVVFRLTTVIEGDLGLPEAIAPKRPESPSRYQIRRRIDGRDRFRRETITSRSHLAPGGLARSTRDDGPAALSYAEALRREFESIQFAGSVTIPRLSSGVRLCDKLIGIFGRDLWLGGYQPGTGEGPRYPMVVGVDWHLDLPQSTRLLLADRRAEGMPNPAAPGSAVVKSPPDADANPA